MHTVLYWIWPHSKIQNISILDLHCNESPIYVFPEKELRGLSLNFHINVSVSDSYIPMIDLPIVLQEKCGPILEIQYIKRSQTHEWGNWY
jgi:hypothetical protein